MKVPCHSRFIHYDKELIIPDASNQVSVKDTNIIININDF